MNPRRNIPSIDALLRDPQGVRLCDSYGRERVTAHLREISGSLRARGESGDVLALAEESLRVESQPSLRRVINATGVVLHTNLGRAPLAPAALKSILECAEGYSNAELDLSTGERGSRQDHVSKLLCQLTGAPAALVVNNCAAAMMLIVDEIARGREVIVSRGELVEIGGSYRVPDILERGGARLIEVGTTNRTRVGDFRRAIGAETGMLLSTHLSNFAMVGFVESPQPTELTALGKETGVVTCLDLGSGLLRRTPGLDEPNVVDSLAAGFDLVAFSGDKLLGATQAGIVLGRPDLIERLRKNPLQRALRIDKLTLSALEGTLRLYLDAAVAAREIPVLAMLGAPLDTLRERAERLARGLTGASIEQGESSVGGGSMAGQSLATWLVSLPVENEEQWAARLRSGTPAILVRRGRGRIVLDVRTLFEADIPHIILAIEKAAL